MPWTCGVCKRDNSGALPRCRVCGAAWNYEKPWLDRLRAAEAAAEQAKLEAEQRKVAEFRKKAATAAAAHAATLSAICRKEQERRGVKRELFGEEEQESESDEDEDEAEVAAVELEEGLHPAKKHRAAVDPIVAFLPYLPPVPAAPAAATDPISTVTPAPFMMDLTEWDDLSDAQRAFYYNNCEGYYSILKMCHPTHVSAYEDARNARRAADEALVRLTLSFPFHPDASPADAASALDRLLSQLRPVLKPKWE